MNPKKLKIFVGLLLAAGVSVVPLSAGTATFDFNTDPAGILDMRGSAEWRETGGVDNSGYLSITDALGGQSSVIVFDDFDGGAIV